jgi:hypothetical protein
MVIIEDGCFSNVYYIDCPKCGAKNGIMVDRCTIPGYRCTDYFPCSKCGHEV